MNDGSFTIVYLALLAVCLCASREQRLRDVLSPGIVFPMLLLAYSLASSLFVNQIGRTNFGYPVDAEILSVFYRCALVGLVGFFAGRYFSLQFPALHETPVQRPANESAFTKKVFVYSALYAAISAPFIYSSFNFLSQQSYSVRALESRVEQMQDSASGLKSVLLVTAPVTLIVFASCLLLFSSRRSVLTRCAGAAVITANLAANLLAGWRGNVMATLSVVAIYYHYRVRKFRASHLLLGSVIVYFLVNAMALVRFTSDPKEMLEALSGEVGENALAFLSLSRSGELLTGTNLMRQIGGIRDGELNYSFGRTILDDILVFVPRPLYPGRPLPSAEKFVDIFYPGVRESGGGYGFFILQEGHWVAGYFGVFAVMCGFGYVVYSIYWIFLSRRDSLPAVFAYSLIFPALCVFSVRTGVVTSLKGAIVNLVPVALLLILPPITPVASESHVPVLTPHS